ncbi:MAG TPA: histidine phosphatase family protein [Jiangellales bacterium]|nr:histidine phosphatase family protein [Jiangellales bacterium]
MSAPPARRVVLWRHGRTEWNAAGRFQGQSDIELDDAGRAQAERAARLLAALWPTLLVSSDLRRAHDTASALARLTGLEVETDPDLREIYAGRFQGLLGAEIAERFPEDHARWREGDPLEPVGGGETRLEVAERVARAVERVAARLPEDGLAVLATHGGAARLGIARLIGLPVEHFGSLGVLSNCSWSMLAEDRSGGWQLVEHNAGTLPEPVELVEG